MRLTCLLRDRRAANCAIGELDLPIEKVLALLSWQPARIAGLSGEHGGPIVEGVTANLCVIDPAAVWVVELDCTAKLRLATLAP